VTSLDSPRASAGRIHRPWTVAPEQGVVQGPLDLALFADENLRLILDDGQLALVERAGVLEEILGPGEHDVDSGRQGQAFFLQIDRPVTWQWSAGAVLWVGSRTLRQAVPIIGSCAVVVADVASFHGAFLHGAGSQEDGRWQRVLDAAVRSRLESRLSHVADEQTADPATIQTLLARIAAADLSEDLQEYGLACVHLAVYTRQGPLVEMSLAGHLSGHCDNND
jgi:hypothetical protein